MRVRGSQLAGVGQLALQWQQACNMCARAAQHGGLEITQVNTQLGGRKRLHKKQDKSALPKESRPP